MPVDFGFDLACVSDLDEGLRTVSGARLLAEACVRRITTPRGMVLDDPDFGVDVRDYLGAGVTSLELARMRAEVQAELGKDERIVQATVTSADFDARLRKVTLVIALDAVDDAGAEVALRLVVEVSQVTVNLLSVE